MNNFSNPQRIVGVRLAWVFACLIGMQTSARSADWSQWRGPQRDGHVSEAAPALTALPVNLKPVWKISVGPGHASPIIADDKLIYLDEQDGQEVVHLIELATGKEIWHVPFSPSISDEWGSGPRSTPFVDGDFVYAQSCRGEFVCLEMSNGSLVWRTSYEQDFGVKFLGSRASSGTATRRGNNGCGVIAGDRLILPVGSEKGASLVCFQKRTGEVLWKSGNDEAAYSSFVVATLAGVKQVVAFTADALLGVQPASGQILWRMPLKTAAKRHAATPVIHGDTVIVNSHTIGLVCIRVEKSGQELQARQIWANQNLRINVATSVLVSGYLYCQGPNKDYVCVNADNGEIQWSQPGFGLGKKDYSSTMVMGDKLIVLSESGTLFLLAADPVKYHELGRLQVCGNTWSFPAYAQGKLFVRDPKSLFCLDLLKP